MQIFEIQEPTIQPIRQREIAVGIDFGTTNSLVAYSVGHKAYIIDDELIPSIIGDIRSIKRLIGKSLDEILDAPEISPSVKEIITEENGIIKLKIGGKYLSIAESIALILEHLKIKAETHLNEEVTKIVITVPAHFDDSMRQVIKHAASIAGLEVLRLISEPTAAAYAYGLDNSAQGIYAVYDLGGGTFDISLLRMQMGVFQVLATDGDINLGGDDIDHIIYEHLFKQNNLVTTEIAKSAKEYLSIHNIWEDEKLGLKLDIESYENLIAPILNRTLEITKSVIENSLHELQGIILVGGSTRISLITKILSQFNVKIYNNVDPDRVVALGAALQAENLTKGSRDLIIDVVPLSLGMELMGGIAEKIILRNTPIPISVTKEFTTYADNQTAIQINIVQGEREMVQDCRALARFELKNIPPMKAGTARVNVTFAIDADGILSVSAIEKVTHTKQSIEICPTYGISNKDVTSMLEASYIHAKEDHEIRILTETLIDAKREVEDIKAAIKETPDLLPIIEINKIFNAIEGVEKSIEVQNRDEILLALKSMKNISEKFIEARMNYVIEKTLLGKKATTEK